MRTTILKPGFIQNENVTWMKWLAIDVDLYSKFMNCFHHDMVPKNTFMKQFTKNLLVDRSVRLEDIGNSAVYAAFNKSLDGKKLFNGDIE